MKLMEQLRAFVQFLKVEFTLVGEENLASKTVPASGPSMKGATPLSGVRPESGRADGGRTSGGEENIIPLVPAKSHAFVPQSILEQLPQMTKSKLDALDFGCVKVTNDGLVQMYNKWESTFAGVDQKSAIGRNFFRELAPCTNNRLIFGRFKEGVAQGELNSIITYAFTYKMRPTLVRVHLYRDPATETNWVLVQKHETVPGK